MPRLPRFLHPPVAVVTALIFFLMLKQERGAVERNLRQVSGKRGLALQWKVLKVFYSFCDLMVSYCFVPQATHSQLLAMLVDPERGAAKIDQCLAAGNGLIVWTAHVGNWEFASRLLEMHGRPVNVARVVEDKPAETVLRNLMASERLRIVDLSGGVPATLELLQALRRNEIVAMQGDRVYQRHTCGCPVLFTAGSLSAWSFSAVAGFRRAGAARLRDSPRLAALPGGDGRSDPGSSIPGPIPRGRCQSAGSFGAGRPVPGKNFGDPLRSVVEFL